MMKEIQSTIKITGGGKLKGTLYPPADKSISHRALLSLALSEGEGRILNLSSSEDVRSTRSCLEACGIEIYDQGDAVFVKGKGLYGLSEPADILYAGNSGTTLRILPGILSGHQGVFAAITGDSSLRKRPVKRIIEPLSKMGACIWARGGGQYAPLAIQGKRLSGKQISTGVASAQVKSAIIYAGLLAEGDTEIEEPGESRDHTERMLSYLGAEIHRQNGMVRIEGGSIFEADTIEVMPDFSGAAFFIVGALLAKNSDLSIKKVGMNKTRTGLLDILNRMGASVVLENQGIACNEEWGDLVVKPAKLRGVTVDESIIPRLIDELPILAVAATQAEGITEIKGAAELRVKESDRIACVASELRKMGAKIEELPDGMIIEGPCKLKGAEVRSHGDHRLAMALAIAALTASGDTVIHGIECAAVSYPDFFEKLSELTI